MQRFKMGDAVLILPRFAHLYPGYSAIVRHVQINGGLPAFTAYTVEFPEGSVDTLLEFQLIDDVPGYTAVFATPIFDSQYQVSAGVRGSPVVRRIILQTTRFNIDIRAQIAETRLSLIGQILEREATEVVESVEVTILEKGLPIQSSTSDDVGVFTFNSVPRAPLNILVAMPKRMLRIVASLSI